MTREEEWLVEYRVLQGLSHAIVAARSANNIPEVVRLRGLFERQLTKMKALSNAAERQQLSAFEHFLLDLAKVGDNLPTAGKTLAEILAEFFKQFLKPLVPFLIVGGVAALLIYGGALRKSLKS